MRKKSLLDELIEAKAVYRRLRTKISFAEKRYLFDSANAEEYLARMRELADRHRVKV